MSINHKIYTYYNIIKLYIIYILFFFFVYWSNWREMSLCLRCFCLGRVVLGIIREEYLEVTTCV